jgi:hypothetical protein
MIRKSIPFFLVILIAMGALVFFIQVASAAAPKIGCKPYNLAVKTGQTFYITVAVTDTTDLYAWQTDATYYPEYLEYVRIVPGDHLRADGTRYYLVKPGIVPGSTSNEMRLAAYTRLSRDNGTNGSGNIAHVFFRAVKQKLDGTNVTLNHTKLVNRNALEITKSLANTGQCKVTISDSAAPLIQPTVGELIFMPAIRR